MIILAEGQSMSFGSSINVIISVVGCLISIGSFFGLQFYFQQKQKQRIDKAQRDVQKAEEKREQDQKDAEIKRKQDQDNTTRAIFKEEIIPITTQITKIQDTLTSTSNGVLASLRNDLIQCFNCCRQKGYAELKDRQVFHDMLKAYHALGGNSYIKDISEAFDKLPYNKKGE